MLSLLPSRRLHLGSRELVLTDPRARSLAREPLATFDAASLQSALERMNATQAPRRTEVSLDADLAQFWLVPYNAALTSATRWRNYAAARFEQTLGPADSWRIEVAPAPPPRDRLAAAVPAWVVTALRAALGRALRSVRIDVLERLGVVLHDTRRFSGAIMDVGCAGVWLFLLHDGELRRVRRRRIVCDDAEAITAEVGGDLRSEWSAIADGKLPVLRAHSDRGDAARLIDVFRRHGLAGQVNALV